MIIRPPTRARVTRRARTVLIAGLALTALAVAGTPAGATDRPGDRNLGSAVFDWNVAAVRAAFAACIAPNDNPLYESRMYAMAHLAMHDALNAIDRRSDSYGPSFTARRHADPTAAVAAAAHDTLVSAISDFQAPVPQQCRDAGTASVDGFYVQELGRIHDGHAKGRGLAAGHRAAAGIIALRRHDGSNTPLVVSDFQQGKEPGEWRFTPGTDFAFAPGWGQVKPFSLTSAGQFPARGPLRLTSRHYARDLNEIKTLGGDGVTTPTQRTSEQTEIALFWLGSLPTLWNRIGRELAASRQLDGWQQARMFAQLNTAMADGYVATFAKKYDDLFWRPVTAIRAAATDNNPRTAPDPTWTPLRVTPPIPDHDSGHAVVGGSAAGALAGFFGTDRLRFAVCSDTLPDRSCGSANPKLRTFARITDAAWENADSRVYVGYHFRYGTKVGTRHGLKIGRWAATHTFRTRPS